MTTSIRAFESATEQADTALVSQWREANLALKKAKLKVEDAEVELAGRAEQKRKDFNLPFAPDGRMSRNVIIDGGKNGKVNVQCEAVFKVQKDLGEHAKHGLDAYTQRFRKRMCVQLGEEAVEDIELVTRISDAAGGRAALSAEAVNKLRKLPLTAKHPKPLRDSIKSCLESLRPLESRVKVKEVK